MYVSMTYIRMLSLPDAEVEDIDGDDEVVSKEAVGIAMVRCRR